MPTTHCANCGKSVERPLHKIKRSKRHYCDTKCAGEARIKYHSGRNHPSYNSIITECTYCGKSIERARSYAETYNNLFCNMWCRGKWMSETIVGENHPRWTRTKVACENCGNILDRQPNRIKRTQHNFCDRECYNEWQSTSGIHSGTNNPRWKGGCETGTASYGSNWTRQKQVIRQRDGHTCQYCNVAEKDRAHDVHHIIPFREFGIERYKEANQASNLITLCRQCHFKCEDGTISVQPYLI